jgi:hypothetical protein
VVAHTGAAGGPGRLRPLNRPQPLRVEVGEDGRPGAVHLSGCRRIVEAVLESWRLDDEWWRERPLSRLYLRLLLKDGRTLTVYQNLVTGRWAKQAY